MKNFNQEPAPGSARSGSLSAQEPAQEPTQAPAPALKPTLEYRARRRKCQMSYQGKGEQAKRQECQNLTHWFLLPKDVAICKTCALFLSQNNHAEYNLSVLAPMLGTSTVDSWILPKKE